jgi:uncharacterized protein (DUF486 family)
MASMFCTSLHMMSLFEKDLLCLVLHCAFSRFYMHEDFVLQYLCLQVFLLCCLSL